MLNLGEAKKVLSEKKLNQMQKNSQTLNQFEMRTLRNVSQDTKLIENSQLRNVPKLVGGHQIIQSLTKMA